MELTKKQKIAGAELIGKIGLSAYKQKMKGMAAKLPDEKSKRRFLTASGVIVRYYLLSTPKKLRKS